MVALTIGACLLSLIVTYLLTPVAVRVAARFDLFDKPDSAGHKSHAKPTPYLGGLAIQAGILISLTTVAIVTGRVANLALDGPFVGLVIAVLLGLVGLADDAYPLPRTFRLGAQIAAAAAAWGAGFGVQATGEPWADFLITIVWIVGITNAVNLIDNMDGLSAGLSGIGAASFAVMALMEGNPVVASVSAVVAGSAFGFLRHNRHPAKIFMGDSGALFLGFLLALLGVKLRFDNLVKVTFFVPVVVLALPIFDTTLVVLSRIRHGRRPFTGARDHVSHRLAAEGLPIRTAVALLYWAGICLGWLGIVISQASVEVGWMLLGFVAAMGAFFGLLLWDSPVYPEKGKERMRRRTASPNAAPPVAPKASPERRDEAGNVERVGYVDTEEGRIFGFTNLPAEETRGAVVICSPFQAEGVAIYRKEVLLARALVKRGFAVQRFHYLGTGNSTGDDADIDLASLVRNTKAAADNIARLSGQDRVAFVGTRLGAVVATAAAPPTAPLALWEPVIDTRRYFRDVLRSNLMRDLKQQRTGGPTTAQLIETLEKEGVVDVLGYAIHAPFYRSMLEADVFAGVAKEPRPILLVDLTSGAAAFEKQVTEWRQAGSSVDTFSVPEGTAWWFSSKPWQAEEVLAGVKTLIDGTADWLERTMTTARVA